MLKTTLFSFTLAASFCVAEDSEGWVNLLADDKLDLWKGVKSDLPPEAWTLKDGVLHFKKAKGKNGSMVTKKPVKDFEFTFEWKISEAGNSGVKYRTVGNLGPEYQILDDQKHRDGKIKSHQAGSLYDLLAAPQDKPIKPVGEWNKGRILVKGNDIEHWLNGTKVVSITIGSDEWKTLFEKSKYKKQPTFGIETGPLYLQDHNDEVWYRNLKLRRFDPPAKP